MVHLVPLDRLDQLFQSLQLLLLVLEHPGDLAARQVPSILVDQRTLKGR